MPATFASSVAGSRALRSVDLPEGSPIDPVAPPIYKEHGFRLSSNQLPPSTSPFIRERELTSAIEL